MNPSEVFTSHVVGTWPAQYVSFAIPSQNPIDNYHVDMTYSGPEIPEFDCLFGSCPWEGVSELDHPAPSLSASMMFCLREIIPFSKGHPGVWFRIETFLVGPCTDSLIVLICNGRVLDQYTIRKHDPDWFADVEYKSPCANTLDATSDDASLDSDTGEGHE